MTSSSCPAASPFSAPGCFWLSTRCVRTWSSTTSAISPAIAPRAPAWDLPPAKIPKSIKRHRLAVAESRCRVMKHRPARPARNVDQGDHDRHLDQRANDGGESRATVNAEGCDRNRYRQLKIVRGRREGKRRALRVGRAYPLAQYEGHGEHDAKVKQQRDRDAHHI